MYWFHSASNRSHAPSLFSLASFFHSLQTLLKKCIPSWFHPYVLYSLFFPALLVNLGDFFVNDSSCSPSQICCPSSPDKCWCSSNCSQISWPFSMTATVYAKSDILIKSNMVLFLFLADHNWIWRTLSHTCQWSSISSSFSIHHLNGESWDSSSWSGHPSRCIVIHSCRHKPTRLVFQLWVQE